MMRFQLDRRGQEIVEYALILPILLLLIFGIIDFGVTIFAYNSISNAAREGARTGAVHTSTEPTVVASDVISATIERTGGLNLTSDNITVTRTTTRTQVAVVYDHRLITGPIIQIVSGSPVLELRSVASMRNE